MTPRDREAKQQEKAAQQAGDEAAQAVKDETGVGDKPPSDPQQLREEIEETREELGDTVEALTRKADVKAQAQEKLGEGKQQLRQARRQVQAKVEETAQRQVPLGAAVAVSLGVLLLLWLLRRG
jgi:Protein of unknown function (DUF3618)